MLLWLTLCITSSTQLGDEEVLEEAKARQVEVALDSDGRGELLDAVLAELRHLYGNVNTLFIHADKQVNTPHARCSQSTLIFGAFKAAKP